MPQAATLTAGLLLACLAAPTQARDDGWRTAGWHACLAEHGDLMSAVDAAAPGARAALGAAADIDDRRAAMTRIDQAIREVCAACIAGHPRDGIHVVDADLLVYAASASRTGLLADTTFTPVLALSSAAEDQDSLTLSAREVIAQRDALDDMLRTAHPQPARGRLSSFRNALSQLASRLDARQQHAAGTPPLVLVHATTMVTP